MDNVPVRERLQARCAFNAAEKSATALCFDPSPNDIAGVGTFLENIGQYTENYRFSIAS
jgi:hypothetical protein